jgi:hypothetical protein
MKLLMILLLLASCAHNRKVITEGDKRIEQICEEVNFIQKMQQCMTDFADRGFDSDGVVKICNEVYKRRK